MDRNKTATLLVELRKSKGLTQTDLANHLDITFQAISKWERGENLPDAYMLIELAKLYGITVDEILKGKLNKVEDANQSNRRKMTIITIAIILIIISPVSVFIFGEENYNMYVPIILVITAISVGLMIYATTGTKKRYIETKSPKQKRKEEIIYSICTGIFLILGLVFDLFHIAWVVFIFGYALTLFGEE